LVIWRLRSRQLAEARTTAFLGAGAIVSIVVVGAAPRSCVIQTRIPV
jgi:hypothetical protein